MKKWVKWFRKQFGNKNQPGQNECLNEKKAKAFDVCTYHNPCIKEFYEVLGEVLRQRNIPWKQMRLVIIDVDRYGVSEMKEEDSNRDILYYMEEKNDRNSSQVIQDRNDLYRVLRQVVQDLNVLTILTDDPEAFREAAEQMYEEYGLLAQCMDKQNAGRAEGNVWLDFERLGTVSDMYAKNKPVLCIPIYKKPWEVSGNLDITVPVGYNNLIVKRCNMPEKKRLAADGTVWDDIDRLSMEFRKG